MTMEYVSKPETPERSTLTLTISASHPKCAPVSLKCSVKPYQHVDGLDQAELFSLVASLVRYLNESSELTAVQLNSSLTVSSSSPPGHTQVGGAISGKADSPRTSPQYPPQISSASSMTLNQRLAWLVSQDPAFMETVVNMAEKVVKNKNVAEFQKPEREAHNRWWEQKRETERAAMASCSGLSSAGGLVEKDATANY